MISPTPRIRFYEHPFASAVLGRIPIRILVMVFQRYQMGGLSDGAVPI